MEFIIWLILYQLVAKVAGQVLRNDPNVIACPQYSIVKNSTISSPLYPEYHPNFYCEYDIQAPRDRYVVIHFEEFDFPKRRGNRTKNINYVTKFARCIDDFVEISDDEKYMNKFRYCGQELKNKEFVSQKRSVKLILQTKTRSKETEKLRGFKATVTFPLRTVNENDVTCSASPKPDHIRCVAPIKRVMTPESSVILSVNKQGTKNCSKKVRVTHSDKKWKTGKLASIDDIINLDDVCKNDKKNSIIYHLQDKSKIIYDVSAKEHPHFEILVEKFSTKQTKLCGGYIQLQSNETFKINYKPVNKQQTCLWAFHLKNFEDNKIQVHINEFSFKQIEVDPEYNNSCKRHHLSIMYVGANMYDMYKHELKKNRNKFKRICKPGKNVYRRNIQRIHGSLTLMMLFTHTDGFDYFKANVTAYTY